MRGVWLSETSYTMRRTFVRLLGFVVGSLIAALVVRHFRNVKEEVPIYDSSRTNTVSHTSMSEHSIAIGEASLFSPETQKPESNEFLTESELKLGSNAVEDTIRRLVVLTAVSDNHFIESQGMLSSVTKCLPHNKIILYDLGLNKGHKKIMKELYKTVEVRPFPFDEYKSTPHVKNLLSYAWKPIIVNAVSQEYDIIMYGDASMRMKSCDIKEPISQLLNFPFFGCYHIGWKAIEFVHDGMIDYLHYPKTRKDIAFLNTIAATGFLLWANAPLQKKFLEPWLDCALHEECIAPRGAQVGPCNFQMAGNHDGTYIGCHRFDQAALDLILDREFRTDSRRIRRSYNNLRGSIWDIQYHD